LSVMGYGTDPRTGRFVVGLGSLPGGGYGAKYNSDGMNAVVCINDGDTHNAPAEAAEAKYPMLVEEYALRQNSGGAGRFRGGLGGVRAMALQQAEEPARTVDPITAEIVRSALVAITDEMKTNLMRTAYNMIIYEALDFTVGLFDADGNTVSIGLGLPMFIRGLS